MAAAAPLMPILKTVGTVLSVVQGAKSLFAKAPKQQAPMQMAAPAPSALVAPEQKRKNIMAAYGSLQSDDRNFTNRTTTFGLGS
jgi:hypothetical protein